MKESEIAFTSHSLRLNITNDCLEQRKEQVSVRCLVLCCTGTLLHEVDLDIVLGQLELAILRLLTQKIQFI